MKYEAILESIRDIASGAEEEWDNSGVQIRSGKEEIDRILVCLEITPRVAAEAMELSVDMILSHHPLIFDSLRELDVTDPHQAMILELVDAGIDVYSAHITFDKAPKSNSWYLADLLGLEEIRLPEEGEEALPLVVGELMPSLSLHELYRHSAGMMDLSKGQIRMVGDSQKDIRRVAVCAGSGGDFLETAKRLDCQALITGDVKYHDAMRALELGMGLIDAGHYGTEKYFPENMAAQLRERLGEQVDVFESQLDLDPFII